MGWPIVEELKVLESEGMVAYDASLHAEVLVLAPVLFFLHLTTHVHRRSLITWDEVPGNSVGCAS